MYSVKQTILQSAYVHILNKSILVTEYKLCQFNPNWFTYKAQQHIHPLTLGPRTAGLKLYRTPVSYMRESTGNGSCDSAFAVQ
jgi:hypothetical protein